MHDLSAFLSASIDRSFQSGAFLPHPDGQIKRPEALSYAVKATRTHLGESPLKNLAYELMGIDFFVHRFRNFPKKPHAPLRPFVEEHFKNLSYAFDAILANNIELPKAWYELALSKPFCGMDKDANDFDANVIYALPRFPFHQGWLDKKELKRSFEAKIIRSDMPDIFAMRGMPKSPWNQDDLIASYFYGILHPELWAGLWAWQVNTSLMFAALYDSTADLKKLYPAEWLSNYRYYADMMSRVCVKPLFPIFLLPGISAYALQNNPNGLDDTLTPNDINRGLVYGLSKGAFGSIARDDDGAAMKHTCPFSGSGARLLMLELADGQRALAAFCMKMRHDSDARALRSDVQLLLFRHCIKRSNHGVISRFLKSPNGKLFTKAFKHLDAPAAIKPLLSKLA